MTLGALSFALSAHFVSEGLSVLNRGPAAPLVVEPRASEAPEPGEAPPTPSALASAVLSQNIFDARTGAMTWDAPIAPKPEPEPEAPPEEPVALGPPALCASGVRLLASVVVAGRPERSFAMLHDGAQSHLVRVGQEQAGVQLVALRPSSAYLKPQSQPLCELPLSVGGSRPVAEARPVVAEQAPAPEVPSKRAQSVFSGDELDQGIASLGDGRFKVSKDMLRRGLADPIALVRGTRFRPVSERGRDVGIRITKLPKDSVLHRLGVRDGDVVRTLNGFDVASTDDMLQAYMALRSAEQVSIALKRGGREQRLHYTVQ